MLVAIWSARLAREARGLDLGIDEDRAAFRGRVAVAAGSLRTKVVRQLADLFGSSKVPVSHDGAVRALADGWISAVGGSL